MLSIIETLRRGFGARMQNSLIDRYSPELIEQKIREAEAGLAAGKQTLATLIQRQRREEKSFSGLKTRHKNLETLARQALENGKAELARDAAISIAHMENELSVREQTLQRINQRIAQMRSSIEKAHHRIIELKQGQLTARSIFEERRAQKKFQTSMSGITGNKDAIHDAEAMIARVMEGDDPFEKGQILDEMERDLSSDGVEAKLAEAGFGETPGSSADKVLARLSASIKPDNNE